MKRLRIIIFVLLIAVFLGSGWYGQEAQQTPCVQVRLVRNGLAMVFAEGLIQNQPENDGSRAVQDEIIFLKPTPVLPQYEALQKQNTDMVGWLRIEDTKVNYPVMQASGDPEYYLHRNFQKEYAYSGQPFLDTRCDINEPTNSLLIYGHNMKDGTMFGELPYYESKSFWRNRQTIQFDLLSETRTYEIIGIFRSKQYVEGDAGFHYFNYIDLSDMNRFLEFIEQVKSASFFDTGVTASWGDQILMLSTCSYHVEGGTFVVIAKYTPLLY